MRFSAMLEVKQKTLKRWYMVSDSLLIKIIGTLAGGISYVLWSKLNGIAEDGKKAEEKIEKTNTRITKHERYVSENFARRGDVIRGQQQMLSALGALQKQTNDSLVRLHEKLDEVRKDL